MLHVEVGGNGSGYTGGFNGGASGSGSSGGAGGGGGASDVRTCSVYPSSCPRVGTSLGSRLLVAGGGGGGGGEGGGQGGAGGIDLLGEGAAGVDGTNGGGGGGAGSGATQSAGGTAGSGGAGDVASGSGGSAGEGSGGAGGSGGIINGGGGGGRGLRRRRRRRRRRRFRGSSSVEWGGGGGGGAGLSFVAPFVTTSLITTDATGVPEVVIRPHWLPGVAGEPIGGVELRAASHSQTLSAAQAVTVTHTGSGPLEISGLTFAGTDPADFVIVYDSCLGQIAANASCVVGVNFAPQAEGARSATYLQHRQQ